MELLNFIDGKFVPSQSGRFFYKTSPFDQSSLATVTLSNALDVVTALQSAKKARLDWQAQSFEQRAETLNKLADFFELNMELYSFQEALFQGLPAEFAKKYNMTAAINILRACAKSVCDRSEGEVLRDPTGVVGIITSWNLSLKLVVERLAPTLAAGNVCVIKISDLSPITGQILGVDGGMSVLK